MLVGYERATGGMVARPDADSGRGRRPSDLSSSYAVRGYPLRDENTAWLSHRPLRSRTVPWPVGLRNFASFESLPGRLENLRQRGRRSC
jgi:hypothetical protein